MLILLLFPMVTFSANFSATYDGSYPGVSTANFNNDADINSSYLATNVVVELEENEMLTIKKIIAVLPPWQNVSGEIFTDGNLGNGQFMAYYYRDSGSGDPQWYDGNRDGASNQNFQNGLVSQNNSVRTWRGYGFKFINQYNQVTYDQYEVKCGWKRQYVSESPRYATVEHSPNWVFYGPGVVKFVPYIDYSTVIDNEPTPSYIRIASNVSGLDVRMSYKIEQISQTSDESKFSVSLDDDGDRVAVGYKDSGSEAVVRVYEYSNGSWEQLGDDVE
tara:strand:- start:357 stop:1181 length:825 start_codon:yes stop_codon:yes gene_type:complete